MKKIRDIEDYYEDEIEDENYKYRPRNFRLKIGPKEESDKRKRDKEDYYRRQEHDEDR